MEAPDPLHRHDRPRRGAPERCLDSVARAAVRSLAPLRGRDAPAAAIRAGVGLSVEAPVRRVAGALREAGRAHLEAIVVSGRSYGTSLTIVSRGPQFVQLRTSSGSGGRPG